MPIIMEERRKKTRKKGSARERGEVTLLTVELDKRLDEALEAFMVTDRRSKRALVTIAIERLLTQAGVWPPKD